MTLDELEDQIHQDITLRFQEYRDSEVAPEPPPSGAVVLVPADGDLQAALDDPTAAIIELAVAAEYAGSFTIARAVEIRGNDATLHAESGPALHILPGTQHVTVKNLKGLSDTFSCVFQLGDNGPTQTTLEQVPRFIAFEKVGVPWHRRRRGFEVNAADVRLLDCWTNDIYDVNLGDSQGVWIHNTPGNVEVIGGSFCAASECLMVGGDSMKIPGVIPTNILIEKCLLFRPLEWQTDGTKRGVKTGLELKTGIDVTIREVTIDGCWRDAQDGWAVTYTPRSGGAVVNVLMEHCAIRNCAGGWNITGHDVPEKPPTPQRTTGIVIRECQVQVSKAQYGGRGIVGMVGMGVESVEFERVIAESDGSQLLLGADSAAAGEPRMVRLAYVEGSGFPGAYGIQRTGGSANGGDVDEWIEDCAIAANTFTNAASAFEKNFPENQYVGTMSAPPPGKPEKVERFAQLLLHAPYRWDE